VDTTEDFSVRLDAVADDTAITVRANRRQRVDCALETIKGVTLSAHDDFKRLVIFVSSYVSEILPKPSRARMMVATICLSNLSGCCSRQ
jgi:hypothetical protein